MGSFEAQLVTI